MNPICYQCGEQMFDEEYYLNNKEKFSSIPKFKHYEHIIHNSLYGKLKANNILCKECGTEYSQNVDTDFVSLFNFITEQIKEYLINKDHGKKSVNTLKGVLYNDEKLQEKRDVNVRENEVSPIEPFYEFFEDTNTLKIYANKKRAKQFKPQVIKELSEKGVNIEKLNIEIKTDISDKGILGIFFSEGVENFNEKFKSGFCKIAVGFAAYCGIKREDMPKVLEINENNISHIISKGNIIPFVPIGSVDAMIEINRSEIEDNYPSHTLILFTQNFYNSNKKHLYCFIDLFSTFQFYVLLNDNYTGADIYSPYYQAIVKQEIPEIDVKKIRYKYLNLVVEEFNIDLSKYKGNSHQEYLDFLDNEVKKYTFNPKLEFDNELKNILSKLTTNFVLSQSELEMQNNRIVQNIRQMPEKQKPAFMIEMREYFNDEDEIDYRFFRKNFIEDDGNNSFETLSTPIECTHITTTDEYRKQYGHLKVGQLNWFIEEMKKKK